MKRAGLEKDFVERTLHIIHHYQGPYGVTLLINCLLGLIVLPKERDFNNLSDREGIHFSDLGIDGRDICWGKIPEEERTAARFIRSMRNSVAHIKIESIIEDGEIDALRFSDASGFEAVLRVEKLKDLVVQLAEYVM